MATIVKTPSGTWKALIRKTGWPTNIKTFRTKRDAEDWARRTEDEMVRGVHIVRATAERMTLAAALKRYTSEVTPTKRPSSQESELRRAAILERHLGKYSLAALSPEIIAHFRDMRLAGDDRNDEHGNTVRQPGLSLQPIAHAPKQSSTPPHVLEEHPSSVEQLAAQMAAGFDGKDWGTLAGRWHDLGKFSPEFQKYIRGVSGYEAHLIDMLPGRVNHSSAGAMFALRKLGNLLKEIAICWQNLQALEKSIQRRRQAPIGIALAPPNERGMLSLNAVEDVLLDEVVELCPVAEHIRPAAISHFDRLPWPDFFHPSISKREYAPNDTANEMPPYAEQLPKARKLFTNTSVKLTTITAKQANRSS